MKRALLLLAACGGSPNVPGDAAATDALLIDAPGDGVVVPYTGFTIQITESHMGANGHTRREVLVTGFAGDGSPLTDDVVITLDRASAGVLGADQLTLGPLGARTFFTPCDAATSGCLGAARLGVARASDPAVELAHVALQLETPVDISTVAPCTGGGDVFYLDGRDSLRYDMQRIDDSTWIVDSTTVNVLQVYAAPVEVSQGGMHQFRLQTAFDAPTPLAVGTFTNLHHQSSQIPGPSMEINLDGTGCGFFTGAYQVHSLTLDNTHRVTSITASFDKLCDPDPQLPFRRIEGCFHYGP